MRQVLCSTGAIITRRNNRDHTLLRTIVPRIQGADGLEFMMYQSWHDETAALQASLEGFKAPVFHMTKQIGEAISLGRPEEAMRLFRAECNLARALGSRLLVLHLWSGQASDQHFERNVAAYPALREIAEEYGLLLTVENVLCNTLDPMTRMAELADRYPEIRFTFDTKMAAFHSQLEALYLPENGWLRERIAHFHVNDYAGGHMDWANMGAKAIGKGHIDFDWFWAFVRDDMGYTGDFTHEGTAVNEDGSIRYEALNASLAYMAKEAKR